MITFTDWLNDGETLDELSRATLDSYKRKAINQRDIASGRSALNKRHGEDTKDLDDIANKRSAGIKTAEKHDGIKVKYKEDGQEKTKYFTDFDVAKKFSKQFPGARVL